MIKRNFLDLKLFCFLFVLERSNQKDLFVEDLSLLRVFNYL